MECRPLCRNLRDNARSVRAGHFELNQADVGVLLQYFDLRCSAAIRGTQPPDLVHERHNVELLEEVALLVQGDLTSVVTSEPELQEHHVVQTAATFVNHSLHDGPAPPTPSVRRACLVGDGRVARTVG